MMPELLLPIRALPLLPISPEPLLLTSRALSATPAAGWPSRPSTWPVKAWARGAVLDWGAGEAFLSWPVLEVGLAPVLPGVVGALTQPAPSRLVMSAATMTRIPLILFLPN